MNKPSVEIALPVLNEEMGLEKNVVSLLEFADRELISDYSIAVSIVDNGSTDATPLIAEKLCQRDSRVRYLRIEERGVGRALKTCWSQSTADIVGFMDVDLATDLVHLKEALSVLVSKKAELVYGSRLTQDSLVTGRKWYRSLISRIFNFLLKTYLGVRLSDGMCGFKFMNRPLYDFLSENGAVTNGWFFSTEILVIAEWHKKSLHELPVKWHDDPQSKVKVIKLSLEYLKAMKRLKNLRPVH